MTKAARQNAAAFAQMAINIGRVDRKQALIGKLDANGNVSSNATEGLAGNHVWVRLVTTGQAIAALNAAVKPIPGIEVWIERTSNTEQWVVTGLTEEGIRQLGEYAGSVSTPDVIASMNNSVYNPRSIDYLRAKLIGDLNVEINGGIYVARNGDVVAFAGGVVDISSHQPAGPSEKVLVLIGVDETTNTLTTTAGSAVGTSQPPTSNLLFSNSAIQTLQNSAVASNPDVLWLYAISIKDDDTEITNAKRLANLWIQPKPQAPFMRFGSATDHTISGGVIDAGNSRFITLQAETGTSDNLDTINDIGEGEEVVLIADSGDTITIKHGTGNIETDDSSDIALTGNKILKLLSIDGTTLRQYT